MENNISNKNNLEINLLQESLCLVENSCNISLDIQTELEKQNNSLTKSNELLESTEYICNESFRVLRNMTLIGKLWNLFFSESVYLSNFNKDIEYNDSNYFNILMQTSNKNINEKDNLHKSNKLDKLDKISKSDEYLFEIEKKLLELENMSIELGTKLLEQNEIIECVDENTDKLSNKLLQLDLEMNKFNYNAKYENMGKFNFIDVESGLALSVNECGGIILCNSIDMNSTFVVYKSTTNLYMIQNLKTYKYLRTDFFGNISFSGNDIGLYEQCFINLEKENITKNSKFKNKITGICILSKNFYRGGWMCNPINNTNVINTTSQNLICTENIIKFQPIFLGNNDI